MTKIASRLLLLLIFFYSLTFSIFLVYGSLARGVSIGNIASLIPFIPLIIYFFREFSYQGRIISSGFRLFPFLTQGSLTLNLTLFLFLTTTVLTTLRYYNIVIFNISI